MRVELKAAFGGVTWLPWWIALSQSSISPLLELNDEDFEYRIFVSRRRRYDEIAEVEFRKTIGTRNVQLSFTNSSKTFTGNVIDDDGARAAIAFLRDKGCRLSTRAQRFLDQA